MTTGNWDATIKVIHPARTGQNFSIATVDVGATYDIVAEVEAGKNIMGFADRHDLFVSVRNLSQGTTTALPAVGSVLKAEEVELQESLRVTVPAGWVAQAGDQLEIVATYRLTAGAYTDYSTARSGVYIAV